MLVITIAASLCGIFWMILYLMGRNKYDSILESINGEDYPFASLYFVGFAFMKLIHFSMEGKKARKRIQEISEIYGNRYAKYYYYVLKGGQFTIGFTILTVMLLLGSLAKEPILALLAVVLAGLMAYYVNDSLNEKIKKRREELMMDFPNVLSKLTLLVDSGLVMREAWRQVAFTKDTTLYREMRETLDEMENGVSEVQAYLNFADRCYVKEIRKFASSMITNMKKGSAELVEFLKEMSDEMWEQKKYLAKKRGDAAASKIMIPTLMIFLGILIMIMVPMLAGISI